MIIVLEGMNGVGKSTVAHFLVDWLEQRGARVAYYRSPGGTQLGEDVRVIVKYPKADICPEANLLLFSATKVQLLHEIQEKSNAGYFIILDRWWQSSYAYQGAAGVDCSMIYSLCMDFGLMLKCHHHVDILLSAPLEIRMAAAEKAAAAVGENQDTFETANKEYLLEVDRHYNDLAGSMKGFTITISTVDKATMEFRPLADIAKDVMRSVMVNCSDAPEVQELFTR